MLTKKDLQQIRIVVHEEIDTITTPKFEKLEKKFDELFNFLDKKYLESKRDIRAIQSHLHLPVSDY